MKKINFINNSEKKRVPTEKKFFYIVVALCIVTVAVTSYISAINTKTDKNPKPYNTKEVLKSSSDKTTPPIYDESNPSFDVIIPKSEPEIQNETDEEIDNSIHEIERITSNENSNETIIPETSEINSIKLPVDGEILKAHSPTKIVYSKTMNDYRIHEGIDISCKIGDDVLSCASGIVKDAYIDDELGATIEIEHNSKYNKLISKYCNLSSIDKVKIGDTIKQGQIIGVVGDTAQYEIADNPHLHFEIIKDGNKIDPLKLVK